MLRDVMGKTFRLLGYTIQYGCIAHCAFEYLGGIVVCSGPSMEPTIQNSDIVFSENLSRHFYCIQKGDIVIAKSPNDPKSNICKRVIGLEGDKVCISSPSDFRKSHSYMIPPFVPVVHSTLLLSCSHRNQYRHLIHTTELKSRRLLECFGSSHSGLSTEGWSWSQAGCQSLFCLQPAGRITSILLYNTDCQIWRVLKRRLRSKKEIFLVEMRIPQ
nr:mitochondrial inner membrane protease subunit 1 isoform X3 [Chelonoidis abingdonii]